MKVRSGFVSNSSSSSFVVAFPTIPHNVDDVHTLLFEGETSPEPKFTTQDFAATIFNDLSKQLPMTLDKIVEELSSGWFIDMDDWEKQNPRKDGDDWGKYWNKREKESNKRAKEFAKEWIKETKGSFYFRFHYADEDGSYYSIMEHGGMFDHLPHQRISHH
jgi:hypothetical protein